MRVLGRSRLAYKRRDSIFAVAVRRSALYFSVRMKAVGGWVRNARPETGVESSENGSRSRVALRLMDA